MHFVLGTAGHIDHGKTLLTYALTGVDTDRLPEEKAKGISIQLGFAPLELPDLHASIVDVPGHEKFVRTMLAGASGLDAALLVVAADDGVMPQTREHFDILTLLDIPTGLIALTKADLVDEDRLAVVTAQVQALTAGSFLENAPILPVSAVTGQGMDALRAAITALAAQVRNRDSQHPVRLPLDRAFPIRGQGTVVTGTLVDGSLSVGSTATLYPQGTAVKVRSLQIHGKGQPSVLPGARVAAALTGISHEEAGRGCTLAAPDSMCVTDLLDVTITLTPDCPYRIRNNSQLHLHLGTQEAVAKLRLLDGDAIDRPNGTERPPLRYAQLKLSTPLAVRYGDRFILRFFSPVVTIGGGTVLHAGGSRHRRNHAPTLARLSQLNHPDPVERLYQRIADAACTGADGARLARLSNRSPEELAAHTAALTADGRILTLEGRLFTAAAVAEKCRQLSATLSAWHRDYPLMRGMPLAQLRREAFPSGEATEALLTHFLAQGVATAQDGFVALSDFTPEFTQQHKIMQRKLLHFYRDAWFKAPDKKQVDAKFSPRGELYPQIYRHMVYNRMLIPLTPRYAVHHEAYQAALDLLHTLAAEGKPVTLAQFRTATDTSRKFAQLFLEHWDSTGITRRLGDGHMLNPTALPPRVVSTELLVQSLCGSSR